ncbi:hypothetical protein K2B09_003882 [Salmonella enterica subsp. enterica]|nr:hypothetical protein [Salmonella enterica subsp. enterica]EHW9182609.1 hypothetical protein [Salmonella enterica subsp. enterica]
MFYPDNDTGIDVMPEIAAKRSDTVKWFTKGGKGIAPTVPGQDTWNIWQAELLNILNLAGIKPDKTKLDQIAQAIRLIAGAVAEGKIDGDIAYRDKENQFQKKNYFNGEVCVNGAAFFNGGVSIDRGDTIYWGGRDSTAPAYLEHHVQGGRGGNTQGLWFCISGYDTGGKFYFRGTPVGGGVADGGRELSPLVVEYVDDGGQIQHYNVYHKGNLDPVTSINNITPDSSGNVDVNVSPKFNGDGAYSSVVVYFNADKTSGKVGEFFPFELGQILPGSRLRPTSLVYTTDWTGGESGFYSADESLPGIWRLCAPASVSGVVNSARAYLLVNRIPIGTINAFSNIRSPDGLSTDAKAAELTCDIAGVGTDLLFTASPNDPEEYGRQLYVNAMAGMYGEVKESGSGQIVVN